MQDVACYILQVSYSHCKWTLFITRSRLLFYFVFRTRSIFFCTIYRLLLLLLLLLLLCRPQKMSIMHKIIS